MSPAKRREVVEHVRSVLGPDRVSQRRACRVLGQARSTQRRAAVVPGDEPRLVERMVALAREYGRYGYRRIAALLSAEGLKANHKRVERLWRREGLKVPQKQPKRGRLWLNDGSCVRLRPERKDHVWSYEIVHSQMTKPAGLAGRPDRERIPDLDVIPGHHDSVDQQLDQLSLPLERRRVETLSYALCKGSGMVHAPSQIL